MKTFLAISACLIALATATSSWCQEDCSYVSMYRVLSVPAAFNGTCVTVKGLVYFDLEESYIWLNDESFEEFVAYNALSINLPSEWWEIPAAAAANHHYCRVSGLLNMNDTGNLSIRVISLSNVNFLECG